MNQEDIKSTNIYTHNNRTSKFTNQKLIELTEDQLYLRILITFSYSLMDQAEKETVKI